MIRICYIISQLNNHGAQRQLYELVKGINRAKFYPIVVSLSQAGYWSRKFRELNIQVIELRRKKNKELIRLLRLIKLFKAMKPDIVHCYLFPANSYGRIAAILTRIPVIIASERNAGELGKDKKISQILIDKFLALFSNGIICNSKNCYDTLIKKNSFEENKVFTVRNGININTFLKESKSGYNNILTQKVVGTIGRLFPHKNHKLFLDMAKIMLNELETKNIRFLIVGDGPLMNELLEYSKKLRIIDHVDFTGERGDIPALLQSMDVFVMTSFYEGMSNSIMEAMTMELPVVVTDVGGNRELVIDGETGYLCPTNDAKTLAERVVNLIKNEKQAERMGKSGKERIVNEFGIERMIQDTENIYMKLLEKERILAKESLCYFQN